jgi:hypothetical protein
MNFHSTKFDQNPLKSFRARTDANWQISGYTWPLHYTVIIYSVQRLCVLHTFIYRLLNNAVSSYNYTALNDRMISELQIEKDMKGHSCGLNWGPVLVLAWRKWGKPLTRSARRAAWQAETWTWDVRNKKQPQCLLRTCKQCGNNTIQQDHPTSSVQVTSAKHGLYAGNMQFNTNQHIELPLSIYFSVHYVQ